MLVDIQDYETINAQHLGSGSCRSILNCSVYKDTNGKGNPRKLSKLQFKSNNSNHEIMIAYL